MLNIKRIIELFQREVDQELLAKVEAESAARRKRNHERMEAIKQEMGTKWIMHPSHKKSRLEDPRPV